MTKPDQRDTLKLSDLPKKTALNQGVDESGCVCLPWNLSEDGDSYLPPPAIVALALNEVGRTLGTGVCTYIPASGPFLPLCIPEVYFTGYDWTEQDKRSWDKASHPRKLRLVSRLRPEDHAIPIRVLAYECPQEGARLSGAIITYDGHPFVGWYREYASRRNGDRINISINLREHQAWFDSMRCQDNFVVVQRLLQMWSHPVYNGVQIIGDVLKKLKDLEERYTAAESNTLMLGFKGGDDIPGNYPHSIDVLSSHPELTVFGDPIFGTKLTIGDILTSRPLLAFMLRVPN
ncbi:hypothetical protein ACJ72_04408 [Emergomyces africanus]|uniref:Uncharacterized protein n=1 Tax=Emergomyces africanus TaxID=1955775 RepID=A0A1B7NWV7_9EURO|nr:hypothetical protein ACJ72_04408 [Emergomyces africanus]